MVDRVKKALHRLSSKERRKIDEVFALLQTAKGRAELDIKKLTNSDFYRVRKGRIRIILHFEEGVPVVDSVQYRDSKTYQDF